jgi:acyl-coenzyme A thioesterase PaaI-like protein
VTLLSRMGIHALTAELTVRFLSPVKVGEPITFTARLAEARRKVYRVEAEATRNGEVVARSEARFMAVGTVPAAP